MQAPDAHKMSLRNVARLMPIPFGLQRTFLVPTSQLSHFGTRAHIISVGRSFASHIEDFHASDDSSFRSLGLDDRVCSSLLSAGFERPAQVQQLASAPILSGKDVVLAAETGSGKTLAYLAPLASLALTRRSHQNQRQSEEEGWTNQAQAALILCPNAALCDQVVSVASSAFIDPLTGESMISTAFVSTQNAPPLTIPDIVVSTPGSLASFIDGAGPMFGEEWTREGLASWVRHVVLDEADLLLSGGYAKHLKIIMDRLREGDRERVAQRICTEIGMDIEEFRELPRHLKKVAKIGGSKALLDAGYVPHGESRIGGKEYLPVDDYDLPWLRQYVFVAATMPSEGDKSVGSEIASAFPSAIWLSGPQLHQAGRNVSHNWHRVDGLDDRDDALFVRPSP